MDKTTSVFGGLVSRRILLFLFLVSLVVFAGCTADTAPKYGKLDVKELKEKAKDISYEELMRNPSKHKGKLVSIKGQVKSIISDEDEVDYYIATDSTTVRFDTFWRGEMAVVYYYFEDLKEGHISRDIEGERIVKEDVIEVWGVYRGIYTYETALGSQNKAPMIGIRHIEQK